MHLCLAKGGAEKKNGFGSRFQKLRGGVGGGGLHSGGGAEFSEGARFLKEYLFFCKHVIFVATLLIIPITNILMSLI